MAQKKNTPTRKQAVAFCAVNSHRVDWRARAESVAKARKWGGATKAAFLRQVESLVTMRREAHESIPAPTSQSDVQVPFNGLAIPTAFLTTLEKNEQG